MTTQNGKRINWQSIIMFVLAAVLAVGVGWGSFQTGAYADIKENKFSIAQNAREIEELKAYSKECQMGISGLREQVARLEERMAMLAEGQKLMNEKLDVLLGR